VCYCIYVDVAPKATGIPVLTSLHSLTCNNHGPVHTVHPILIRM
jgi:hypothetical protein